MPTLSATSAPYTGVPSVEPVFNPHVPQLREDIRATPEAFGAQIGEAVSGLGRALGQSANELAATAEYKQQIYNQVTADDQTNKYSEAETKILYGDPAVPGDRGFYGLSGEDAMRAWPTTRDKLTGLRNDMRGGLTNDIQRMYFDRETRTMQQRAFQTMGYHYDQQFKDYATKTNNASQDLAKRTIATNASDQAAVDAATKQLIDAGYKNLQLQGLAGNDAAVWDMEATARADAATAQIDAIAQTDPVRARVLLDAAQQKKVPFTAQHLETIQKSLDAADARAAEAAKKKAIEEQTRQITGGSGGKPLVEYTPSTDILQGTGLSAAQFATYRTYLASRESSSYDQPPNAGGYMGRYQMGKQEIADTAKRLGVPVPSQAEFLSNPQLQEKFFDNYTLDHHNTLMQESETYRNASPQERAAILAGAHLGGTKGVENYLEHGTDAADANGTRISNYIGSMRRAMASTPAAEIRKPQAAAAPGGGGKLEVWGDSLGVGLNGQLKTAGYTHGGDSPETIFGKVKEKPEDYWQGKTIVLSSGSNRNQSGADQMQTVEDTIKYLKDHGANVMVVGYGTNTGNNYPQRNAQLKEIAGRLNVPVIAAEQIGSDGVHPGAAGYASMADKIRTLHQGGGGEQDLTKMTPEQLSAFAKQSPENWDKAVAEAKRRGLTPPS